MTAPSFESAYDLAGDCQEFVLANEASRIKLGGKEFQTDGEMLLQLVPVPHFILRTRSPETSLETLRSVFSGEEPELVMCGILNPQEWRCYQHDFSGAEGFTCCWHTNRSPLQWLGDDATEMEQVVFHVFNFPEFYSLDGTREQRGFETRAIQKLHLRHGNLSVTIRSIFESSGSQDHYRETGSGRLTHVAQLEHFDKSSFNGAQAARYLQQISCFLSFAAARPCNASCACGFDDNGNRAWEAWLPPVAAPVLASASWVDPYSICQLEELFECVLTTLANETWRKPITEAVDWYMKANDSRQVETGIILTQTALELLAFVHAVVDKRLITRDAFKKINAGDQRRLLLASIGIPVELPTECQKLSSENKLRKGGVRWIDLPHALVEIRNSIIHPEAEVTAEVNNEAWRAGLWMLELSILRALDYGGNYRNRLQDWEVQPVPWQTDDAAS